MSMMMALPVCAKKKWTEEMNQTLKEMQEMYFWRCGVYWLSDHGHTEGYMRNLGRYSIPSLKETRERVVEEQNRVQTPKMVIDAICQQFGLSHPGLIAPPALPKDFHYTGNPLELYNPMDDSQKLKAEPSHFEQLRNNYPLRREKFD